MNRFIIIVFCLSLLGGIPAHAQERELKSGLNYTTIAKPKTQMAAPAKDAVDDPEAENKTSDPATTVWNKYKELATGQAASAEDTDKTKGPSAPEKPSVEKPEKPSMQEEKQEKQQNAFSAILDEWKNSKDNQREMRSKSFKTPSASKVKAKDPS